MASSSLYGVVNIYQDDREELNTDFNYHSGALLSVKFVKFQDDRNTTPLSHRDF